MPVHSIIKPTNAPAIIIGRFKYFVLSTSSLCTLSLSPYQCLFARTVIPVFFVETPMIISCPSVYGCAWMM